MYKIMVVDDEPYVLEQLHLIIDHTDLQIHIVEDCSYAAEALKEFIKKQPDIVITDISMPDMDGLQLISEMQKVSNYPVEYILLSGFGQFDYAKQAIELNVSDYLLKPIFEEEMFEALLKAISKLEKENYQSMFLDYDNWGKKGTPLSAAKFYSKEEYIQQELVYSMVEYHGILDQILLLFPEQAKKELNRVCKECSKEAIAPNLVIASMVSLLCDAGMDEELSKIFSLQEWFLSIEKCETLEALKHLIEQWIGLCSSELRKKRIQKSNGVVGQIKKYVDEHFQENITLTELAGKFYVNPVYLGQAFRKTYSEHFHAYVTRRRMEEAKYLLIETDLTILQVASTVGYGNYIAFKNNFVASMNMTPSDFRKNGKGKNGESKNGESKNGKGMREWE